MRKRYDELSNTRRTATGITSAVIVAAGLYALPKWATCTLAFICTCCYMLPDYQQAAYRILCEASGTFGARLQRPLNGLMDLINGCQSATRLTTHGADEPASDGRSREPKEK